MISWHVPHSLPEVNITKNRLYGLIVSSLVSRMAMILVGIFSSVYVYEISRGLGYSLVGSVNSILIFFILHFLVKSVFLFWAEDLSRAHGFKAVIRYSTIPFILFLLFLYLGKNSLPLVFLAGMVWGAESGLYWWGYHGLFAKLAERGKFATSISKADVAFTIGALITPLLGALLIDNYGFGALMLVSALLMVVSVLFLGTEEDLRQKHDVKLPQLRASITNNKRFLALFASRGATLELHGTLWPLYIFLVLGSILDLGIVISASTLASALLMVYVGKYIDKHGERKVLSIASIVVAISWVLRVVWQGLVAVLTVDITNGFGLRMYQLTLDEMAYKRARKTNTAEALLMREVGLIIGALSILVLSMVVITITGNIVSSFIIAVFFAIIPLGIKVKNDS